MVKWTKVHKLWWQDLPNGIAETENLPAPVLVEFVTRAEAEEALLKAGMAAHTETLTNMEPFVKEFCNDCVQHERRRWVAIVESVKALAGSYPNHSTSWEDRSWKAACDEIMRDGTTLPRVR